MTKKRIILIVSAVFIAIVATVVWWQFGNIRALYYSFKYSDGDIDRQLSDVNKEVDEYLADNPQLSVRPVKPVEEELHKGGVIDDEELTDLVVGDTAMEDLFGTDLELSDDKKYIIPDTGEKIDNDQAKELKEKTEQESKETAGADATQSPEVSRCIAQMYVIKSNFVSRLDGLYSEAVALYRSYPADQKKDARAAVVKAFYSRGLALEAECDAQVASVLSQLEPLLKAEGGDMSLISKIKSAYDNEKSLKKAYYLNQI